jgi:flagellar biosynthesis anti-sigma factor FlgM
MPLRRDDEVRKFKEMAKTIPDVRQEKIDSIKKQLKSGKYNVPAEAIAKSIAELHDTLTSNRVHPKKTRKQ